MSDSQLRVVIDPGHGGWDRGLAMPGVGFEAAWTLAVAHSLAGALAAHGVVPVLTREQDDFVPLLIRNAVAKECPAQLVVGLHGGPPVWHRAAAVRLIAPWWHRARLRPLLRALLEALDAALAVRETPGRSPAGLGGPRARPPLGRPLLVLVGHPPANGDPSTAMEPSAWGAAIATGILAWWRSERSGASAASVAAPPGEPAPTLPSTAPPSEGAPGRTTAGHDEAPPVMPEPPGARVGHGVALVRGVRLPVGEPASSRSGPAGLSARREGGPPADAESGADADS